MRDTVRISASAIALGYGRMQYRVVVEATGEIKNFVSSPARVKE
jgi:hypothetical protein